MGHGFMRGSIVGAIAIGIGVTTSTEGQTPAVLPAPSTPASESVSAADVHALLSPDPAIVDPAIRKLRTAEHAALVPLTPALLDALEKLSRSKPGSQRQAVANHIAAESLARVLTANDAAITALGRVVNAPTTEPIDPLARRRAVVLLARLGPRGVTTIAGALKALRTNPTAKPEDAARFAADACSVLMDLGPGAAPAAAEVVQVLALPDDEARRAALMALLAMGKDAAPAKPAFEKAVADHKLAGTPLAGLAGTVSQRLGGTAPPAFPRKPDVVLPERFGGTITPADRTRDEQMMRYLLSIGMASHGVAGESDWRNGFEHVRNAYAAAGDALGAMTAGHLANQSAGTEDQLLLTLALLRKGDAAGAGRAWDLAETLANPALKPRFGPAGAMFMARMGGVSAAANNTDPSDVATAIRSLVDAGEHDVAIKLAGAGLPPTRGDQIDGDPRVPTLMALGTALRDAGRNAEAISAFNQAVTLRLKAVLSPRTADAALLGSLAELNAVEELEAHFRTLGATGGLDPAATSLALQIVARTDTASAERLVVSFEAGKKAGGMRQAEMVDGPTLRRNLVLAQWAAGDAAGANATVTAAIKNWQGGVIPFLPELVSLVGGSDGLRKYFATVGEAVVAGKPVFFNARQLRDENAGGMPNVGTGGDPTRQMRRDQGLEPVVPAPATPPKPAGNPKRDERLKSLAAMQTRAGFAEDAKATLNHIPNDFDRGEAEREIARTKTPPLPAITPELQSLIREAVGRSEFDFAARLLSTGDKAPRLPRGPETSPLAGDPATALLVLLAKPEPHPDIGRLIDQLRGETSVKRVLAAFAKSPHAREQLYHLAASQATVGQPAIALSVLAQADALPGEPDVFTDIAKSRGLLAAGKRSDALAALRKAFPIGRPIPADLPPDRLVRLQQLGETWTYAGDSASAFQFARALPASNPARLAILRGIRNATFHRLTGFAVQVGP